MDILKRLWAEPEYTEPNWKAQQEERKEAADEIERLREALRIEIEGLTHAWAERNKCKDEIERLREALETIKEKNAPEIEKANAHFKQLENENERLRKALKRLADIADDAAQHQPYLIAAAALKGDK